eukprot:1275751-Amphidinium_carterae.1
MERYGMYYQEVCRLFRHAPWLMPPRPAAQTLSKQSLCVSTSISGSYSKRFPRSAKSCVMEGWADIPNRCSYLVRMGQGSQIDGHGSTVRLVKILSVVGVVAVAVVAVGR